MDWQELTSSHPALAIIPSELRTVTTCEKTLSGQTLFRLGDRVRDMLCVVSGEVRLIRRARNGTEIILQRSRTGFFAEASLSDKVYHCDAMVAKAGELLRFRLAAFRSALNNDGAFRDAWLAHLAVELRRLRAQCERLSLKSAAQRVIHYIASEGTRDGLTLGQSRKAWASELGLTHEALYRTLRQLEEQNIVHMDGTYIKLLQPASVQTRRQP